MKNVCSKWLPLLCSGCAFFTGYSQAWNIYSTQNSSIPSDIVWCLAVDPGNNMKWVGTDWGLAGFDGSTWTIYTTSNSGIPDNSVRSLAFDKNGDLWVGSFMSGLARFDGSNWTVYNTSNSGIPDNFIKAIAFDTAGFLWVGTPSGLGKYDWNSWTIWDINNSPIWSHHITCIHIGNDNIKRIGTLNGGLLYWNDTLFTKYSYWDGNFPENTISSIDMDAAGKPWIAMASSGLNVHLGGPAWNWMNTSNSLIPSDILNHIQIDNAQNKYLCSQNKGLLTYVNNVWTYYDSTNSPFPDTWATQSVKDTLGILWIGTWAQGLVRLDESQLNGIAEEEETTILIGPIPAGNFLMLTFNEIFTGELDILDLSGRMIEHRRLSDVKGQIQIDISALPPGTFFLYGAEDSGRKTIRKLVKYPP
ncbi:MAG: hypothetical protein IT233_07395 [Bacteroidia bacterium]|nr:hypothetical protein [Bacteroidia bacterium]